MFTESASQCRGNLKCRGIAAFTVGLVLLTGCSSTLGNTASTTTSSASAAAGEVDPQVLSDVIEGAFPVPGGSQLRTLRVYRAADSIINTHCGGTPYTNLEYTGDRINQAFYADLDLIRTKGLVEEPVATDRDATDPSNECAEEALPNWTRNITELGGSWDDILREVAFSAELSTLNPSTASCLRDNSGLTFDETQPTAHYLTAVDEHLSGVAADRWQSEMMRLSAVYADCTPDFFEEVGRQLLQRRPAVIERHRETLTAMAEELADAGYVP